MNIRGRWNELHGWQKHQLTWYAIDKTWKKYWLFKKKYLLMNEKE